MDMPWSVSQFIEKAERDYDCDGQVHLSSGILCRH